ncbi:HYR domain-containing protein [Flavobacterium olei]
MRNFTFNRSGFFRLILLIVFLLLNAYKASAQFYTKHYIAPAPWQYFSKANEIVIATNSTTTVTVTVSKSDGTNVTTLTCVKGAPAIYRFAGKPSAAPALALDTVLNAAGLIVSATSPVSINLRNVASDALGGDGTDKDIKGNAALTSFGDAGIGVRFRVGYYRDGSLGNFGGYGDQRPIYSMLAINNGTSIKLNGNVIATLNAGESYLFKAPMGSLVESSNPIVMNTSAAIDTPNGGCGDAAYNQIPPEAVLGSEYFIERGKGVDAAEQTTVIATKPNTTLTINSFSATGALITTVTKTLVNAGDFYTFLNGISNTNFSASRVLATNNVVVYSGTAQSCEVDVSTIAPVSECGGSNFVETAKFRNYGTGSLPYFGYILLKDASSQVMVNGANIETIAGIGARHQLGSTGWYLINFEDTQIGSPNVLSISSTAKLTVSIVQQGGGFSMAGFFSNFAARPEDPTMNYISAGGCTNSSATLTTPANFSPYQWFYNGVAISGANSNSYVAAKSGSYSVSSTLACGSVAQSKPVSVTLCTDLGITKTVNIASPCVNSNIEFTVTASNLGLNNATGVSVNDLLPSGYTFVSSTASVGIYNSTSGVWSIGDLDPSMSATLKVIATVKSNGIYNNTAAFSASVIDSNAANNSASVSITPKALPIALSLSGSTICTPSAGGTITSTTSVIGVSYQLYNSGNVAVQTAKSGNGSGLSWSNIGAGTGYYVVGTNSESCSSTSNVVSVINDTQKPTITCPASVTKTTDANSCTATGVVLGTPVTADNCGVASVTNNAPSAYPIGVTTVTWTVKDNSGNTQTCTQTVTISDNQKPTITCPANVTKTTDTNSCTATGVVLGTPVTADNCGIASVTNDAPSTYPIGVTTVTWTAKDNSGNIQTCTQTVTINDNQKPTITCPANVTKTTDANSCTATGVVLGTPVTADNCGIASVTNDAPHTYPIGVTTVTWTAKDNSGNTQTCTQTVTITDNQKPTITCPANITVSSDVNSCTATGLVLGTPVTADNCSVASVINNAPASYPVGNTTVVWTVTDAAGNTETCNQIVKVVGPIKAQNDIASSFNGLVGGTAITNVLGNDFLNCNNVILSDVSLSLSGTLPSVLTFDITTGAVSVNANTPTGTYSFDYKICEKANTNNCSAATATVEVVNGLVANADSYSNQTSGTTAVNVGNVTSNDKLNGTAVTSTNTALTPKTEGPLSVDAEGELTLEANTASGTYTLTYNICESGANPSNCKTATATVEVVNGLVANTDSYTNQTSGTTALNVGNVTSNDKLNGTAVTSVNTAVTPKTEGPLSVDADGKLMLEANTASGTYTLTYNICESGANPSNCKTATATVEVVNGLVANTDSYTNQTSGTTAVNVGNVTSNDKLNGTAVTSVNTAVTPKTEGPLSVNAEGELTLEANTASGTYTLTYNICESGANPSNCKTATATVEVVNGLVANTDSYSNQVSGTATLNVGNVTSNDKLNGTAVTSENTDVTSKTEGPLKVDADGELTLAAKTPSGTYTIEYTICESGANPSNCKTATATVEVVNGLVANTDSYTNQTSGTTAVNVGNVTSNDKLNGTAVTSTNTAVTPKTEGPLSVEANGELMLEANTASGTYTLTYNICESGANPSNCKTATATVEVVNGLVANTDSYTNQTSGTTALNVGNVTSNDKLNGTAVTSANTAVTPKTEGPLSVDANGELTLEANTASGTYTIEYTICESGANPSNCKTATATVEVINGLVANTDSYNNQVSGTTVVNVGNVTSNDKLNGTAVTSANTAVTPKTEGPLSVDANGELTLEANTASGTYTLTYNICESGATPSNCKTATATVEVKNEIKALIDNISPINGNIGGTTTISLIDNDTLNGKNAIIGVNPGNVTIAIIGTLPTGLTLNANGTITVAPNTPAANYNVQYTICELGSNPSNCDTVTSIVPVTAANLVANADAIPSVTGSNTAQDLGGNVLDNDTKDGQKLNPSDVKLTVEKAYPKGYLVLNADGTLTLGANAPAGKYELTYTICEKLNSGNCSSNTVSVTVTAPVIDAIADTITPINGNVGDNTISLVANDTLNGSPVVIGTNAGEVTFTLVGTLPTGLTLNADYSVTVAPNTPAANYEVKYTICDNNNSGNCDTVTSIVPVTAANLVANADAVPPVTGSNTAQDLGVNVLDNDTKDGQKLNPSDIKLTVEKADPKGYLILNADGTLTLGANAPAGNYELTYTICEKLNSGNCSSNTVSVTVTAPVIDAIADTVTPINGNIGDNTISLVANDTLNGSPVVIGTNAGEVTFTLVGTLPTGLTLNADYSITVAPNTAAGNYEVKYTICDNNNSGNCDTVTSIVPVTAANLVANADAVQPVTGSNKAQDLGVNVLDNDTKEGQKLNPSDVKLTVEKEDPKGYLVLNADGTLTLGANAPAGNYELTYTICEKLNSGNCSSNTVSVTVTAPVIDAIADTITPINGNIGDNTISLVANDTLNGSPVVIGTNAGEVTFTLVGTLPTGLTLNADYTITVAPNTAAGNYEVKYTICDNNNSGNCDTVTSIVPVTAANLVANSDEVPPVTGSNKAQGLGVNVLDNDTKDGQKLNPLDVKLTVEKADPKGYLVLNADGTLTLGANAPAGNYELTYTICEKLNSGNCSSNTVSVTVTAPVASQIIANNDVAGPVDSKKGLDASLNIFANDILNGVKPNPSDVILKTVVANPNLVLNSDGSVNIAANTPSGIYQLTYQICEAANTSNCSQAIVKITVQNSADPVTPNAGQLNLVNDTNISVDGINGSLEFVNVLDNDLIDGQPINPANVIIKPLTTSTYFEWNTDGTVNVKPNTPGATYTLNYQVCEKANPANCSTAVLTVFVEVPSISVIKTAVFNDENKSGFANAGETISYRFTVTNTGNVPLVGITLNDPLPGVIVSGQAINLAVNESNETNFTAVYKITQQDINRGSVSNQASVKGRSARGVEVEDQSDDMSNSGDSPTVLDLSGCSIQVMNAFSPNGDDKNARFYIRGIECYPDNTVEIYNRWGVLVFAIDQYNNSDRVFVGYSNGRSTIKQTEGLPVGTYFYILKYKDSANHPNEKSGYLYINK